MVSVTSERCSVCEDHEESTNIKGLEDVWRQMSRGAKKSDYGEKRQKNMKDENGRHHET